MPIDLGIGFEELEKLSRPPLIPDGTYEVIIDDVIDSPVRSSGRPQWKFTLKIVNNFEYDGRLLFLYAQLPWQDPQTGEWDYSNTFTLVNLVNATGVPVQGRMLPDREVFKGRGMVVKVKKELRKGTESDPEPVYDNRVQIVTKKKGSYVS